MLIQLEDVAKPNQSAKANRHLAIVVDNKDPENLGRIKVKVKNMIETADDERLPWIYPYQGSATGGNPANSEHVVPQINTQVMVVFPEGHAYSAFYEAAPNNKQTTKDPANSNPVPEAPKDELRNEADPNASDSTNIINYGWRTTRGHPNWFRIDRNQGKFEIYMGEADLFFHFDRGGNVQLRTPGNVDFKIGGKFHIETGKEFVTKVGEQYTLDVGKDATVKTAKKLMMDVGSDMSMKVTNDRGATIGGYDDTAVTKDQRTVIAGAAATKAAKMYRQISGVYTLCSGSSQSFKSGGVITMSASSLIQLGAPRVLINSSGGAGAAAGAACAAVTAFFVAAFATGSSRSATAMPTSTTPIETYFPPETDLNKPLSEQTPAVQQTISEAFKTHIFNGDSSNLFGDKPMSAVLGDLPMAGYRTITNVQEFISKIPQKALEDNISPNLLNGLSVEQLFTTDLRTLLLDLSPIKLLEITDLTSIFGLADPMSLLGKISPALLNGFSLQGLLFDFIGQKIIQDFMKKFAVHLTALAKLMQRVSLIESKLNALNNIRQTVQTRAEQFDQKMQREAQAMRGNDIA